MFLCLRSPQPQVRNLGPARGPASRSALASGTKKSVPGPQCEALRVPGARRTPLLCLNTPGQAAPGGVSQQKVQRSIAARACARRLPRAPKSSPRRGDGQAGCWGSGSPPNGASQGCDPLRTHRNGALLSAEPGSCFSRGLGAIFSPCYGTWCRMAASELLGFLIGGVDVKAK